MFGQVWTNTPESNTKKSRRKNSNPRKIGPDQPVQCNRCEVTVTNNVGSALHSIHHSDDEKYTLEMHMRAHEGTTKYKCEICDEAFELSSLANQHKFLHPEENPFLCEICGKHYFSSNKPSSHCHNAHYEAITGSSLSYDCAECGKRYTTALGLKKHRLTKHEKADLSVICETCGKRLSSKEKLKYHIRTHTGFKPHRCLICPKAFSKKEHLVEHVRIHTGEKPFLCKSCGRGFAQRTPLKVHEKIHSRESFPLSKNFVKINVFKQ